MRLWVRRYRHLFWLVGAALFGLGVWFFVDGARSSFGDVHQQLLEHVAARGWTGDNANLYLKCLLLESACSSWYWDQFGAPDYSSLFLIMGGLMMGIFPQALRHPQKPYSGAFALLDELHDLRHKSWGAKPLRYALLIGFYLPLPEQEPLRGEVIRGHTFPHLDKCITAVPTGYGGRRELGHLAAFGATRSGKTLHLTAQAATWEGSFIALDIKGEIYNLTAGLRAETGPVYYLSPEGKGHRFDAIGEILKSTNGELTAALIICEPHKSARPEFAERAANGLAAIFAAALRLGVPPLEHARETIVEGGITTFITEIAEFDDDEVRQLAVGFLGMGADRQTTLAEKVALANQNRFLTSAWDVMTSKLNVFLKRSNAWMFSGNDFEPADLMRRPASVYLAFPEATLTATAPVYNMLVTGLMIGMTRYVDETRKIYGARWAPPVPVLVGLDELKRAPVPNLDDLLSTAAGRNITAMLYVQSPSQFDDLYGKAATESILANCGVQLYYKIESLGTAEYLQRRGGKVSVDSRSTSRTINRWFMPVSRSEGTTPREVFTVEEAQALGGERREVILAHVSGKRPFLCKRVAYFEHAIGKLMGDFRAPPVPVMEPAPLEPPVTGDEVLDRIVA